MATTLKKQRTIKPTARQKKAARIAVENDSASKKAILLAADYSEAIATQPHKVMETKGYKAALAEYGLTEQFIATALYEDIRDKPKHRVQELTLAANITGMNKREESSNKILIVNISNQAASKYQIKGTETDT